MRRGCCGRVAGCVGEWAVGSEERGLEVSEARLKGNFRALAEAGLRRGDGSTRGGEGERLRAMGLETCSVALARAGAKWLGVASASEGGAGKAGARCGGIRWRGWAADFGDVRA